MGYIEIPTIDCYLPIYHGTDEDTLKKGIGHIEQTSFPIGGDTTHSVLTGHTGLPEAELFTRLDEMEIGDIFYIHILDEVLAYKVYGIKIIEPEDVSDIVIENNRDLVTLLTCTPYGINTHRLLVMGERTELTEETTDELSTSTINSSLTSNTKSYIIGIIIGLLIILIILIVLKKNNLKRDKEE